MFKRFFIVALFGMAFAYIESAVVVYLRVIFHPGGFTFPMAAIDPSSKRLLLTEIGREAATLVLILTGAWLFGKNRQQRFAYFMAIFAVWDIFYYVWLKVLINWPASISDWDILFLIPVVWASPFWAPVLTSVIMLFFAVIILYRDTLGRPLRVAALDWLFFVAASLIVVVSFCISGSHIDQQNFNSYFYRPLFAAGNILAVLVFLKCYLRSGRQIVT
ncbi:MAG: hypothetical protein A2173_03220 [Planctomycetes bacterium RBG_13_44_8b]|nr:MAG: hypothetical protein A2173_03220 [Planctomycetes bacterium RBG_13_44_8b]